MKVVDVLGKTVIGNYILREIIKQEVPSSGVLNVRVTLRAGDVKKLEFTKEAKK